MKKILIIACGILMAVALNTVTAHAYTVLTASGNVASEVYINASGTIAGNTLSFLVDIVQQNGTTTYGTIDFPANPAGRTNSLKALRITGGSNVAGARIIISTENNALFTDPNQDPRQKVIGGITRYSGSDGSGMIGSSNQGYVAGFIWGTSDNPNSNPTYVFQTPDSQGRANWSYIVDKWHKYSYVPANDTAGLDTMLFYKPNSNAPETNDANEGTGTYKPLYPQYWDIDLYDRPYTDPARQVVAVSGQPLGLALYKTIGTVAYNVQQGSGAYEGYYICQMSKFSTVTNSSDYVTARLRSTGAGPDQYIYIAIGADFSGLPAQSYNTPSLYVAMVQDEEGGAGGPAVTATTYYNDAAHRIQSITLASPDGSGNTYYEYINENFKFQGYGRISKSKRSAPDADGALSYEYIYHEPFLDSKLVNTDETWTSGTYKLSGLKIESGHTFAISGTSFLGYDIITLNGIMSVPPGADLSISYFPAGTGLTVGAGGTVILGSGGASGSGGGSGRFVVNGTLRVGGYPAPVTVIKEKRCYSDANFQNLVATYHYDTAGNFTGKT